MTALETGIRYSPGKEVYFSKGSSIDLTRFTDVQRIWIDPQFPITPRTQFEGLLGAVEYLVIASGHGGWYTPDMEQGKPKVVNLNQAIADCAHWESRADTIAGRARILHLPTGKVLDWIER